MNTLHLVRTSAFADQQLALCQKVIQDNDTLILMDDGCYNVNHIIFNQIAKQNKVNTLIVEQHAKARNISNSSANLIDLATLLALSFSHNNVITWQ